MNIENIIKALKGIENPAIMIYGIGNPGRQDDGLGINLCDQLESWTNGKGFLNIHFESNYQLNIEDEATIKDKYIVIFADASKENINDFLFTEIIPSAQVEFTMHHVSPSFVVYLCNEIYKINPKSYLLHIKGYEWDFNSPPTDKAINNLNKAVDFIKNFLTEIRK